MTPEELSQLAMKYLSGKASLEERRLLDAWYYENPGEEWVAEIEDDETHLEHRMLERLKSSLGPSRVRTFPLLRVAAILVLVAGIGATVYYVRRSPAEAPKPVAAYDVAPGSQKAVLTLANGSSVLLDSSHSKVLATQGNASVRQLKGGSLAYEAPVSGNKAEVLYNTLSVPRGGQYKLELPDGSKVWLDAASSIHYPVSFTGKERIVEMTGEAYFEIAPDPDRPFIVRVGDREAVQVLGTRFNVNAYEDEGTIRTTLLEGKVNVTSAGQTLSMRPGEEAIAGKTLELEETADLEAAVAWKEGFFDFNSTDITSIMRQISRWYDVTVAYEGDVQGKGFTGQISRYANVSQVLHMLELTKDIHFKIEGGKITVMP